jgi:hypothetical protein
MLSQCYQFALTASHKETNLSSGLCARGEPRFSEDSVKNLYIAFAALWVAFLSANPACAQSAKDETWIRVGAFLPNVNTEVSIARPGEESFTTLIDLESDLDLSDRGTLASANVGTRLSKSWRIEGEFFSLGRKGEKTLARDIVFDGVTYPVSATLSSKFNSDVYRLAVGYSFLRRTDAELGVAVGAHVTDFGVQLSGIGSVGGATASTEVRRRQVLAPLPTIGLYGNFEPLPKVTFFGRADYLSLKIKDYDGRLLNLEAGAGYSITKNIRLGALYRRVDYRLQINKDTYTGLVKYKFNGPTIFAELTF